MCRSLKVLVNDFATGIQREKSLEESTMWNIVCEIDGKNKRKKKEKKRIDSTSKNSYKYGQTVDTIKLSYATLGYAYNINAYVLVLRV